MSRVKFNANTEYAYLQNFKVLQSTSPFLPSQFSANNIPHRLILLHNIICAQMHRNYICRITFQPSIQLPFIRNVDSEETRVAFVVAVVGRVATVVFGFAAADEVDGGRVEGRGLEALPEFGAPADYFGYGVAEGHVADWGVGGLGGCRREQAGEGEEGGE